MPTGPDRFTPANPSRLHEGSDRFTLAIQSGLYEGVVETVPEGRYRIGSDLGADIVLVEDSLAPSHVVIGMAGSAARIEALAPGVVLDEGGPLAQGRAVDVPLPAGLSVAGIQMKLARQDVRVAAHPISQPTARSSLALRTALRTVIGLQAIAVLVLLMVPNPMADAWGRVGPERTDPLQRTAAADPADPTASSRVADLDPVPVATGSTVTSTLAPDASRTAGRQPSAALALAARPSADAAEALRAEADRAGLLNIVVEPGSGIVTASGTIEPSASARWQSVQQWFDERFAGEVTLVNGVSVKAEKLPGSLGIEAVWRGEQPHLIIKGQKYLEGAVLDGGWAIRRIEAERVLLERDGRLVAVRF